MDIAIAKFFESIRTPVLTPLFCALTLFGETLFLVLAICVIYWIVDKAWGERMVVVTFSALSVGNYLKGVVGRARPYASGTVTRIELDNPLVSTMGLNDFRSFPSGHSIMGGSLFFSTAFAYRKKKWLWVFCPLMTVGVMVSRLYLGVHYFTDVLAGAAIGIVFASFWDIVYAKFASKKAIVLLFFALVSVLFACLAPSKDAWEQCGMAWGAAIAVPLQEKFIGFDNANGIKNRVFRLLIGLSCVGVVFGLFSYLPFAFLQLWGWKFVKYFLTVLSGALLAPYLFTKLKI